MPALGSQCTLFRVLCVGYISYIINFEVTFTDLPVKRVCFRERVFLLLRLLFKRLPGPEDWWEVQLDLTPEIEVSYMLFRRCHTKYRKLSIKQHTNYFNFRRKIQLDRPVRLTKLFVMPSDFYLGIIRVVWELCPAEELGDLLAEGVGVVLPPIELCRPG